MDDIKVRIAMAKNALNKRKEMLSKIVGKEVRKRIIKTLVCSMALYGCETWTLRKDEINRLNEGSYLKEGVVVCKHEEKLRSERDGRLVLRTCLKAEN